MNKTLLALVGVITLSVGGASAIALQSHAQKAVDHSTPVNAPAITSSPSQEHTQADTDNIQNDPGGVETPDATVSGDTDTETNDDHVATSTVERNTSEAHGEGTAADTNEVEDGN